MTSVNAPIELRVGIMSRKRQWDEPFTPTVTTNEAWAKSATLDDYQDVVNELETTIMAWCTDRIAEQCEVTVHVAVHISNVTHAPLGAGVVPLAKANHDFTWSQLDLFKDGASISDALANVIQSQRSLAKY